MLKINCLECKKSSLINIGHSFEMTVRISMHVVFLRDINCGLTTKIFLWQKQVIYIYLFYQKFLKTLLETFCCKRRDTPKFGLSTPKGEKRILFVFLGGGNPIHYKKWVKVWCPGW